MTKKHITLIAIILSITFFISCDDQTREVKWLEGTTDDMLAAIADQLRGFDMAMVETGYRYSELYWAGEDGNWEYALYQAEKTRTAIENGLQRRPARAASAETFLTIVLPEMKNAIETEDSESFRNRFNAFTSTCNSCHEAEDVEYMKVQPPQYRTTPIVKVLQY